MSAARMVMMVVAAAGVVAVGVVGWRAVRSPPVELRLSQSPAPPSPPQPASPEPPQAPPALAQKPAEPAPAAPPPPVAPAPQPVTPSLDVVRVEPSGDMVIAGRAAPRSRVTLSMGNRLLAEGETDALGHFVLIPPALSQGDHLLDLRSGSGAQQAQTTLAVSVPTKPADKTLAAVIEADKPTRVPGEGRAAPARPEPGSVAVRTVEAGEDGAFFASGSGPAGATVRLYLNDSFVADVTTAADGSWGLRVERGMSPGHYDVRADLVVEGGKVAARAQVPFDYPQQLQAAKPMVTPAPPMAPAPAPAPAAPSTPAPSAPAAVSAGPAPAVGLAVVPELQSITVVRGDSLWRISRRILGQGQRYTQIYEANPTQIRDPNRIFPGQVLVAPRSLSP
jgi:nucleoid-associated protein YgaU